MPDSPNPAWKKTGPDSPKKEAPVPAWKKAAASADAAKGSGARAWQNQNSASGAAPQRFSPATKRGMAAGLLVVLIVGTLSLFYYLRPPKLACLVLVGNSYDDNLALPHNIYGWHGLKDLAENADNSPPVTRFFEKIFATQTKVRLAYPTKPAQEVRNVDAWNNLWKSDLPQEIEQPTVIVVLSFHGGADAKGAYLFLNDPCNEAEKIRLKVVLEKLSEKWPDKNILLVLEPALMGFHWTSGMLQNDFVRKLKGDVESHSNKKLLVLCASDQNQVSWPSEEWGRTIFSHYFLEGLLGAADNKPDGNGDLEISVGELHNYVAKKVADWSQSNRGTAQTPILLGANSGRAHEIGLVKISGAYTEKPTYTAPGGLDKASDKLQEAWAKCFELGKEIPGPQVYSPHLWRQYRDTLLRWEQIERANAAETAENNSKITNQWSNQAANLAAKIKRKVELVQPSWEISHALPLPAVLGHKSPDSDGSGLPARLWEATNIKDNLAKKISGSDVEKKVYYTQLCQQILRFFRDDTTIVDKDLMPTLKGPGKAANLLLKLESAFSYPPRLRPVEVQYLLMLLEEPAPKTPVPVKYLRKALAVRMLAEETALAAATSGPAHPYSEVVVSWTKKDVENADHKRRLGEDWLFGSTAKDWDKAWEYLARAEKTYESARALGNEIRQALELRDEVLADLPYYAEWLAQWRPGGAAESKEKTDLVQQLDRLAANVGQLTWCLDQQEQSAEGFRNSFHNPKGWDARQLINHWMTEIKQDFRDPDKGLPNQLQAFSGRLKAVVLPKNWHDIQAALAAPLLDPGTRRTLLDKSHVISAKLHDGKENQFLMEPPQATDMMNQKTLALAVTVPLGQTDHPLASVELDKLDRDGLSTALGRFWHGLSKRDFASPKRLAEAEFESRLLPGGIVPKRSDDLPYEEPAYGLRKLRLHDLLLWQGQRVFADYYWQGDDPYHVKAAHDYADMAEYLAELWADKLERSATAKAFRQQVQKRELKLAPSPEIKWTSEISLPLSWTLQAEPGVPGGVPMYRLPNEKMWLALEVQDWQGDKRWTIPPERFLLKSTEESKNAPANSTLTCYFRGRLLTNTVPVVKSLPTTIVHHFPPDKADLAFRLDKGFNYGAISFVLDTSNSMGANKVSDVKRIDHAIQALKRTLEIIPDNTYVSVMVFDNSPKGFKLLRGPERWDNRAYLNSWINAVKEQTKVLADSSPIAATLVESLKTGFPPEGDFSGPKLIVALTDGDDNFLSSSDYPRVSWKNDDVNYDRYNKRVASRLEETFKDTDVRLFIVCFNQDDTPANKAEIKRAREQFGIVQNFIPKGEFKVQKDPGKLAYDLELAIRPRLTLSEDSTGKVRLDKVPIKTFNMGGLQWHRFEPHPFMPDSFKAWVQDNKKQDIVLNTGDNMILTLKRSGSIVQFEHSLFAEEVERSIPIKKVSKDSWLISVLSNQINKKSNSLHQVIAIEKNKGTPKLQQVSPGFIWIEVKPKDGSAAGPAVWKRDYSYPAPALELKIGNWPAKDSREPTAAATALWWDDSKYPANSTYPIPWNKNQSVAQTNSTIRGPNSRWSGKFLFETVEEERHVVETGARGETSLQDCLAVRLEYAPGKPVFVRMDQKEHPRLWEKHCDYAEANKYTAYFWPIPNNFTLQVISLEDFKRECAEKGRTVRFEALAPNYQNPPQMVPETP